MCQLFNWCSWISRRQSELLLHWILMHIHIWKWMHITCDLYYASPWGRQNDRKKTYIFQHKLIFPLFTWPNQIVSVLSVGVHHMRTLLKIPTTLFVYCAHIESLFCQHTSATNKTSRLVVHNISTRISVCYDFSVETDS